MMAQQAARYLLDLAPGARSITPSATLATNEAVAKRRADGHETLHLAFGQASFPLPERLREALGSAARNTAYAPVLGLPALRQAIAAYLTRTRQLSVAADQVIVGPGSKPLLYALLHVLDGDLLLPVPSWVSYAPQAGLAGRRVFGVETDADDHHRITPEALAEAMMKARREGADPRVLLVNTPSNPTGGMFAAADAEAIADWVREADVTLISDEIYAELAHGWREHISPARFYPEGSIITGGLSKAFSAGGWRLGYAVVPATGAGNRVAQALLALASEIWSATASPIQEAAVTAFDPSAEIETYLRQSALLHGAVTGALFDTLMRLGIPCPRPAGGFYLYPDFAPWRPTLAARGVTTSQQLAHYLLDEWGIATLPATEFGEHPDALRLRLSTSMLYGADDADDANIAEAHDAALQRWLAPAEREASDNAVGEWACALPLLRRAQEKLTAVVEALG